MVRRLAGNPTLICACLLFSVTAFWYFAIARPQWTTNPGKAVGILGTLLAGVWTLYVFLLRGSFETSLAIDLSVETQPKDGMHVVFLQIKLNNIGGRRITAPTELSAEQIADYEDSVMFPCDLQLHAFDHATSGPQFVGWWSRKAKLLSEIPNVPTHISVLHEYTGSDQKVDFFMEPGEKYVLGHVFVLPAGHYIAKLVFVGERATAAEYWSRIYYFHVPKKNALSR
jgi:hypothetical protein